MALLQQNQLPEEHLMLKNKRFRDVSQLTDMKNPPLHFKDLLFEVSFLFVLLYF